MTFGKKSILINQLMKKAGITYDPAKRIITGTQLRDTGTLRMQLEGAAKAGKTRTMLDIIRHMHEVMKLELDEILLCIIDFDKDGIHSLLESEVLPRKYHKCIRYWKIDISAHPMLEAYHALEHFEAMLEEHRKKTGVMGVMAIENLGTAWTECQSDYCKIVYKKSIVEMLMESKVEAERRGKLTHPALNQLHDYKIINPFWLDFANAVTMGNYHLVWTCYQMTREVEEAGGKKEERICGQGQKDNDGKVDSIVVLYKRKSKYYATLRGARGISGTAEIAKPNFTKIITKFYAIMQEEIISRYRKQNLGEAPKLSPYWLTERGASPEPVATGTTPKAKPAIESLVKKPKPLEVVEPADEEIDWE